MPFEVKLNKLPAGYLQSVDANQQARVIIREFVSSEDGDLFISRLEGIPSSLIAQLPEEAGITPGVIEHMLAILYSDKTAKVYVNEVRLLGTIRYSASRDLKEGEPIYQDDILDIHEITPDGVEIPRDAGFVFIFSAGWRKGLFYDLSPLSSTNQTRDYDLATVLGHYFAYLSFQHLFQITDREWTELFKQHWFPFASLRYATRRRLLKHVKNQSPIDGRLGDIAAEVKALADNMLDRWMKSPFINPSYDLIQQAVNRYLTDDYISSTSILYPTIEGVMRRAHHTYRPDERISSSRLATNTVQLRPESYHEFSLLLPLKFNEYLENVYFANFDPGKPAPLSRHSIAHGVASPSDFSLKAATIGLLTLDQVSLFLPSAGEVKKRRG